MPRAMPSSQWGPQNGGGLEPAPGCSVWWDAELAQWPWGARSAGQEIARRGAWSVLIAMSPLGATRVF